MLEINESHPIFSALTRLYAEDQDRLREYAGLLYNQALLIEGMSIDNPAAFSDQLCSLMARL